MPKVVLLIAVLALVVSSVDYATSAPGSNRVHFVDQVATSTWTVEDVRSGSVVLTHKNRRAAFRNSNFHGQPWREIILVKRTGEVLRVFVLPWQPHYNAYAALRVGCKVEFTASRYSRQTYEFTRDISLSLAPSTVRWPGRFRG